MDRLYWSMRVMKWIEGEVAKAIKAGATSLNGQHHQDLSYSETDEAGEINY